MVGKFKKKSYCLPIDVVMSPVLIKLHKEHYHLVYFQFYTPHDMLSFCLYNELKFLLKGNKSNLPKQYNKKPTEIKDTFLHDTVQ